eukprot:CAMPEP_0169139518 /NCGR_PEP_ID=MMETSP1015-20121227/43017_1 /TAXON_ID=342587 /ORGANISM="Karlodinium micrum, Strain CCMP2283" /LENGTH=157 /DNA_ID=CAMNT_0009205239 /DNA_START=67 /DNA_END=540 /DNA_ORIENTATION=+
MQALIGFCLVGSLIAQDKDKVLVRSEQHHDSIVAVGIDHHSFTELQDQEEIDDPCRNVGCNSGKCTWVTGEVVAKVSTKKTCSNARKVGSLDDNSTKIETLTQCLRAVKKSMEEEHTPCSPFFELHMETMHCACVPENQKCTEKSDKKVCRLHLTNY